MITLPYDKASILNLIIQRRDFTSYLEIGVDQHVNFDQIQIEVKESVDPNPDANPTYLMTSDEFFEGGYGGTYDLIFIDGLHHGDQVYKDIYNAMGRLSRPDSIVVLHDMCPNNIVEARREFELKSFTDSEKHVWDFDGAWNGDSWLGFAKFRTETTFLTCCVDTDWGLGFVDFSKRWPFPNLLSDVPYKLLNSCKPEELKYLSWELLNDYKSEILGLVSPEDFLKMVLNYTEEEINS